MAFIFKHHVIEAAMEKWELEKPDYAEKDGYFVITFKGPSRAEKPLDEEILKNLNERQKKALDFLKEHSRITTKDYFAINNVSERTARNDLVAMVDKKILQKIGKTQTAYYVIRQKKAIEYMKTNLRIAPKDYLIFLIGWQDMTYYCKNKDLIQIFILKF